MCESNGLVLSIDFCFLQADLLKVCMKAIASAPVASYTYCYREERSHLLTNVCLEEFFHALDSAVQGNFCAEKVRLIPRLSIPVESHFLDLMVS